MQLTKKYVKGCAKPEAQGLIGKPNNSLPDQIDNYRRSKKNQYHRDIDKFRFLEFP
jgi:hypothetical protein